MTGFAVASTCHSRSRSVLSRRVERTRQMRTNLCPRDDYVTRQISCTCDHIVFGTVLFRREETATDTRKTCLSKPERVQASEASLLPWPITVPLMNGWRCPRL